MLIVRVGLTQTELLVISGTYCCGIVYCWKVFNDSVAIQSASSSRFRGQLIKVKVSYWPAATTHNLDRLYSTGWTDLIPRGQTLFIRNNNCYVSIKSVQNAGVSL